jgi:hypothetical protein
MREQRYEEDCALTMQDLEHVSGGSPTVSLKLLAEILSNVSKTRSEISAHFARSARA